MRTIVEPQLAWDKTRNLGITAAAVAIIVFVYPVADGRIERDRYQRRYAAMLDELRRVPPPPHTERHPWWRSISDSKINDWDWAFKPGKPHQMMAGTEYTTELSWQDVVAYYNQQMRSNGWHFKVPYSPETENGAWEQLYCSEDVEARIIYHHDQTYDFRLNWKESNWAMLRRLAGLPTTPETGYLGNPACR